MCKIVVGIFCVSYYMHITFYSPEASSFDVTTYSFAYVCSKVNLIKKQKD